MFAAVVEQRLQSSVSTDELAGLRLRAEAALSDPEGWGTTFTLVQAQVRIT